MSGDADLPPEVLQRVNAQVEAFRERRIRVELRKHRLQERMAHESVPCWNGDGFDGLSDPLARCLRRWFTAEDLGHFKTVGPTVVARAIARRLDGACALKKSLSDELQVWLKSHGIGTYRTDYGLILDKPWRDYDLYGER